MLTPDDLVTFCQTKAGVSVNQLVLSSGVPRRTLYGWWKSKRRVVELLVYGVKSEIDYFTENSLDMDIRHTHLSVLIRDGKPVMTMSDQTYVEGRLDGDKVVLTLHHKTAPFFKTYADHIYIVPLAENKHLLKFIEES